MWTIPRGNPLKSVTRYVEEKKINQNQSTETYAYLECSMGNGC